jgi:hypothetical protein
LRRIKIINTHGKDGNMKTRVLVTSIIIILLAAPIYAKDSSEKYPLNEGQIAFAKENILMGLRSGNSGLMEACFMLISKIKMSYRETNVAEILTVIDSLALASPSFVLRYKAFLVSNICAHPEWFDIDNALDASKADNFFASAARLLQQKMFPTLAS